MTRRFSSGPVAAADLGSNSFHLAVGEIRDGELVLIDKLKERVALAEGLDDRRELDEETQERAIACLRRFGARLADLPAGRVRACGTNTLRAARNSDAFLARAEEALGHPIEIVEGAEEARLVYRGVAWSDAPREGARLVVDIGGGSTEIVLGEGLDVTEADSLRMGCVTWSEGFFPDGRISADRYQSARFAASLELREVAGRLVGAEPAEVLGASGTLKAVGGILRALELTDGRITGEGIDALVERVLAAGCIEDLDLPGLSDSRRPVIVGGLAIVDALVRSLDLAAIRPVEGALREGVLAEMVQVQGDLERRDLTVAWYQERLSVNRDQAARVRDMLGHLVELADGWRLARLGRLGAWAAELHEIGLFVRRAGYHKHGAYLLEHSDLPGFSRGEQQLLAALVLCHRRKFRHEALREVARDPDAAVRLAALLRVAVRLCRGRSDDSPRPVAVTADGDRLELSFDAVAPDARPLLELDLRQEQERLERAGIALSWSV